MGDVKILVNSSELPVLVSSPERAAPWPGVVVLHDVGGMKEDLPNQTRWLAQEGFLTAAPNLYFRGGMMKYLFAIARDLGKKGVHEQNRCHRVLYGRRIRALTRARSRIYSGQCELLAPLPPDAETFLSWACPIVGSYGGKDPWNRGVAQKLEETLAAAGIAHDVKEYPQAGHSFLNNHDASFLRMLQIIYIGYDGEGWRRRIVSFFESIWAVRRHHTPVAHP